MYRITNTTLKHLKADLKAAQKQNKELSFIIRNDKLALVKK